MLDTNPDKHCVKINLFINHMWENSDKHELRMYVFDNGNLEEFIFLQQNYNMTLDASVNMADYSKVLCLSTFLCRKL